MSKIKLFATLAVLLSIGLGTACTPPQPAEDPVAVAKAAEDTRLAEEEAARQAEEEAARKRAEEERLAAEAAARAEQERIAAEAREALLRAAEAALQDINFDYNRSDIRRADRVKFQAIADFMNAFPDVRVLIEGHCDERGTIEYNMTLGEKRAFAARAYLIGLGISETRFRTVSFGKERPKEFGNNERSWHVNRRCEFKLQ